MRAVVGWPDSMRAGGDPGGERALIGRCCRRRRWALRRLYRAASREDDALEDVLADIAEGRAGGPVFARLHDPGDSTAPIRRLHARPERSNAVLVAVQRSLDTSRAGGQDEDGVPALRGAARQGEAGRRGARAGSRRLRLLRRPA